jgi:hypothetical protein
VVHVKFYLKYFIAATLLSLTLLLVDHRIWIVYGGVYPTQFLTYLFPLARLVIAVFLPFAIMYFISTKIQSWTHMWPILISTFLGCLLGGIINVAVDFIPVLYLSVNYGYLGPLVIIYEVFISILLAVFSEVLFVSIAAILFAYYHTHPDRTILQPTQVAPST